MPAIIDAIEPHRQAVRYFGAVIYKDGDAVPAANTGLLTSATEFSVQNGVEIARGSHVVSIEASVIGSVPMEQKLIVDGVAYINRGPVRGRDLAIAHFQVVPEVE